MRAYLNLLSKVLHEGERRPNRTGVDTISLFGQHLEINLSEGYPLLTTKKVYFKGIIYELLWMLKGETNIRFLQENNVHIWDGWADKNGDLGPVYGKQWRDWNGIDQIKQICEDLQKNPFSRRMLLCSWNVAELKNMSLPPCHLLAQFYVRDGYLDCSVYQRSGDMFLGIPFDIASYAALTQLLGQNCGYKPGRLVYTIGDAHIYTTHIDAVQEQLTREPGKLPSLQIKEGTTVDNATYGDFILSGYNPMDTIKAEVVL